MAGLLLPVGGYKGYGLALVVEILSSVLTGATFGLRMSPMSNEAVTQDMGHFFIAMDIDQFIPLAEFRQRMEELMAEHRDVPVANGVERLYLPGEIEHLRREQRLVSGIPLEPYIIEALIGLGQELGLDTQALRGE